MAGVLSFLAVCLLIVETINSTPVHSLTSKQPTPSEVFPKHVVLDSAGNFHLFWKFNSTHITFEAHVKTRGYVGLGLSPNGKMYPADVVIGWVKHGHTYFEDRHSTGHFEPIVDASQDWILLHGEENDFGTVIKTVRKLDTCDDDDVKITNDTFRVIYSYNGHEPRHEGDSLLYHGVHRGAKSVMLLAEARQVALPNDTVTQDLLNSRYLVPDTDTTYMCRVFDLSDLVKKHHMIKVEPIIQKGNEGLVHHILLHKCYGIERKYIGVNFDCYHTHNQNLKACANIIIGWAIGGEDFYYPEEAGLPMGEPGDSALYILETHYNNPGRRNDFVDNSGFRLTLTPTLRRYDAAVLTTGLAVNDRQIVPPFEKEFISSGICTQECLRKGLDSFPDGVNIVSVLEHGHLLARQIRTRIIRNGTELEPLVVDDNYDFNYQEYRNMPKTRKLMSGDELVVECTYDSSQKSTVTYGGFPTSAEMCLSFIVYYPRMVVDNCESIPMYDNLGRTARSGHEVASFFDWTSPSVRSTFKDLLSRSKHWAGCNGAKLQPEYSHQEVTMLIPDIPFIEPQSACPTTIVPKMSSHPTTPNSCGSPSPTEQFDFEDTIDPDGKYVLFWNVNKTHIVFEMHVETKGYIGFGLSPNGKMYPSDVIVGWVKDGVAHFKDRHTVGHSPPLVDASQDWHLLYASEDDCRTVLKMVRKLDTCDDEDYKITDNTVKIIYSYHPSDPTGDDAIPYHGSNRGVKSLLLLSKISPPTLESDAKSVDFMNNNYHVPAVDTTYSCRIFDLSTLQKKHHLIKFEVLVQKGHEVLVHHLVVYKCPGVNRNLVNSPNYVCHEDPDKSKHPCGKIVAIWAVGGEAFYFPDEAGLPVAEPGDTDLYIMETHYNNPGLRNDFVDSSGIRLTLTPTLRLHDAGVIEVASMVDPSQVIPPNQRNFVSSAYCNESALHLGLKDFPNGVHVFGVQQHAHLLGKAIKTRLIHRGVEQEPLADDRYYDFNYQDFRRANRTLRDGDSIILECTYDSTKRTNITYGGFSTSEEMCAAFIFHYPRSKLVNCLSKPLYDRFHQKSNNPWGLMAPLTSTFNTLDWTNTTVSQEFMDSLTNDTYFLVYGNDKNQYNYTTFHTRGMYPKVPYTAPVNTNCGVQHVTASVVDTISPTNRSVANSLTRLLTTLLLVGMMVSTTLAVACKLTGILVVFLSVVEIIICLPAHSSRTTIPTPSETFPKHVVLDSTGNYHLFWKFNSTHITFEAHVKTRGYVGLGLSPNGKMYPADVVIGWVKHGHAYLTDRHSTGHFEPIVDASQDWILLHGEENDFGTVIKTVRKLDTCDDDDVKITNDTIRVIYSYNDHEPAHEGERLLYHGVHRGAKSVMLLAESRKVAMPNNTITRDLLNNRYLVPDTDTTYMCRVFDLSDLGKKHHMIKVEPVIQQGHEELVHHILLHKCNGIERKYIGVDFNCYHSHNQHLKVCANVIVAWAVGGKEFYYPEEAGLPMGEAGDDALYIMETHYNNPGLRNNYVDNSGFRLTLTPTLRRFDAGVLTSGLKVNDRQIVPPFEEDFHSSGFCTQECLSKGLDSFPTGVDIIAVLEHGHLLARKIRTRIIRNGTELEPLAVDNNYDFNYQEYRNILKTRKLMSGDSLVVDCIYDSRQKSTVTYGGLATTDEMCLSFIVYYPRMAVESCQSAPLYDNIGRTARNGHAVASYFNWTSPSERSSFNTYLSSTKHMTHCSGAKLQPEHSHQELSMPIPNVPYVGSPSTCPTSIDSKTSSYPTTANPCGPPSPTEQFDFHEVIDSNGKYLLFWNVNKTHIVFETHVETKGYIGFGLSPNGKMYPSDVIVGWVKDGVSHFQDRHTVGHSPPLVDASQDWHLLYGSEDDCRTVLKMVRKLDTCDDEDYKITDDTVKIIFSYHPDDPHGDDGVPYHGSNRGVKSLLLLSKLSLPTLESDAKHIDITNNYHVPAADTTYSCHIFDLSNLQKKHHLIKFEVLVQKGHEGLVHHLVVYKCPGIDRKFVNSPNYLCYEDPDLSKMPCGKIVVIWAVGGEAFYYPDEAGLPVAEPGDTDLYIMEIHYNNPGLRSDFVDHSGIRLTVTPTLRLNDAGIITVIAKEDPTLTVPPHQPNFVTSAFCNESILHTGLKDFPNGVHVFGVQQHAHLLAKAIKTRVIRGGVEQKPLADDRHYDFNYQDFRRANRTLRDGDSIIVECTYDSTGKKNVTYGGLSTSNEMCEVFLFHYPRSNLTYCQSKANYDRFNVDADIPWGATNASFTATLNALDWRNTTVLQQIKDSLRNDSYNFGYANIQNEWKSGTFYPKTMYPTTPYKAAVDTKCGV
ncbi:uncharacterized protein LOC125680065 [Ostrea edulis]|uniref:uncharacterized protein LOC125680065 n=1 Tax=Ostrea edulis TaxID=37623 RepID=UPI0024AF6782|nr:uncharacterized protein LOC125680065 [Ostrea edulis]